MIKKCPRCGVEGPVTYVFGWRQHRGTTQPQGLCRACRCKKMMDPLQQLRWLYAKVFPNDRCTTRATKFMLDRIKRKPDRATWEKNILD